MNNIKSSVSSVPSVVLHLNSFYFFSRDPVSGIRYREFFVPYSPLSRGTLGRSTATIPLCKAWGSVFILQIYNFKLSILNLKYQKSTHPATNGSPVVRERTRLQSGGFKTRPYTITFHLPLFTFTSLSPTPFCDQREPRLRRSGATFPGIPYPISCIEHSLRALREISCPHILHSSRTLKGALP